MFQRFALIYFLRMERRTERQDTEDMLQQQLWYTDGERYNDLFFGGYFDEQLQHEDQKAVGFDASPVEEVTDIDELDAYFDRLEEKRSVNGGQVLAALDDSEGGWL